MSNRYLVDGQYEVISNNVVLTQDGSVVFVDEKGELTEAFNDSSWGHIKKGVVQVVDVSIS